MRLTHFLLVTTVFSLSTPAWAMNEDREDTIEIVNPSIKSLSHEERAELQEM